MKLTDEQIAAIRDGTEGATPGPWVLSERSRHNQSIDGGAWFEFCRVVVRMEGDPDDAPAGLANAAHIARCDPDTIHALATEVLESRAEIARLTKERDEAIAALGEWARKAGAAEARVAELEGVAVDVMASLAAAISLLERGGKKAAASDKMFAQMLVDYNASLARARAALRRDAT